MNEGWRTGGGTRPASPDLLRAITFDFGNTLVPVTRAALGGVVETLASAVADRLAVDRAGFLAAWDEERARQLREDVPAFRELDLDVRMVRILARLRGMEPPPDALPWDDAVAAARSDPAEIDWAVGVYSDVFVARLPPDPAVSPLLARLARRHVLAVLSNWPLASTIDRYVERAGWAPHLAAVVVSQRVGVIKPHPGIFRAAEEALAAAVDPGPAGVQDGAFAPASILHVGDDPAADVEGAQAAGWRAALVRSRPPDSPLPELSPVGAVKPDLVLDRLLDLEPALALLGCR
ncbi:MAG: family hydrolase [Chloroflexi bacterium]|nr:family hydrolase [Chloroflexota bacterium]